VVVGELVLVEAAEDEFSGVSGGARQCEFTTEVVVGASCGDGWLPESGGVLS
jgi:hypothetical protein